MKRCALVTDGAGFIGSYLSKRLLDKGWKVIIIDNLSTGFRDLIYIDDAIEAFMKAIDNTVSYGKVYNIATGKKTFVWELLDMIIQAFRYEPEQYPIVFAEGTPGDQHGIYGDYTKIKKDIGWEPKVNVSDGIRRMANWVWSAQR